MVMAMSITADSLLARPKLDCNVGYDAAVKGASVVVNDASSNMVDHKLYRSMIGSLLYVIASRPDIMFSVCMCARFFKPYQEKVI